LNLTYFMKDDGGRIHPNDALGAPRVAANIIGKLKLLEPVI